MSRRAVRSARRCRSCPLLLQPGQRRRLVVEALSHGLLRLGRGQDDGEGRALAELASEIDEAAVHLDQSPRDGQAQAGAEAMAAGLLGLEELFEDGVAILGRDARTGVAD